MADHPEISPPSVRRILEAVEKCPEYSEKDLKKRLGRKWRKNADSFKAILRYIQEYIGDKSTLYIPQTCDKLLAEYGNQQNIHNVIQSLVECGILCDIGMRYIMNVCAKYYYVNQVNLATFFIMVRKDNPNYEIGYAIDNSAHLCDSDNINELIGEIHIGSQLEHKRIQYSKNDIPKYRNAIRDKYKFIPYYERLTETLNLKLAEKEKIVFSINISPNTRGFVSKVGLRATSKICNLSGDINDGLGERIEYLKTRFGDEMPDEYDVNASILRNSASIMSSNSCLRDGPDDFYRTIFEKHMDFVRQLARDSSITWNDARPFFKIMSMRLSFSSSYKIVAENLIKHEHEYNDVLIRNEKEQAYGEYRNPDWVETADYYGRYIKANGKEKLLDEFKSMSESINQFFFKEYNDDTAIFAYESCIYLEVRKILADRGIDVVQVYDGFFFKHGTMPDDMEEILSQAFDNFMRVCEITGYKFPINREIASQNDAIFYMISVLKLSYGYLVLNLGKYT